MALNNLRTALCRLTISSTAVRGSQRLPLSWHHCKETSPLTALSTSFSTTRTSAPLYVPRLNLDTTHSGSSVTVLSNPRQPILSQVRGLSSTPVYLRSLWQMHLHGPRKKKRKKKNPLEGKPFARGVVLKTLIKKPRKPNSANRKCVLVRLSTGKEMVAYVPGEGHNLQEHNIVLVRPGRLRDTPGVKIKCVRGKYDLPHVVKKQQ